MTMKKNNLNDNIKNILDGPQGVTLRDIINTQILQASSGNGCDIGQTYKFCQN